MTLRSLLNVAYEALCRRWDGEIAELDTELEREPVPGQSSSRQTRPRSRGTADLMASFGFAPGKPKEA